MTASASARRARFTTQATPEERPELDETRREALARMGRFAGYTAPVMPALLGATKARAAPKSSPQAPVPL